MLQRTFQMRYYLRAGTNFRNSETMQTFLQEVAASGYHVVALSEYEKIYQKGREYVWSQESSDESLPDDVPPGISTPAGYLPQGVSMLAQGEAMSFATDESRHLWLAAFPVAQHELTSSFSCGLSFPAQFNTGSIMITLATIGFAARTSDALLVFERWLELFKVMWRVWQPLYAHSYAPHAGWPEPDDADIQALRLSSLYEVNFFSQELVERLGKTRVSQTPAWRVQSIDEDSILLIPEFIFVPRGPEEKQGELAAQHLGLRQFLRGRYLPTPAPQHG